MKRTPSLIKPIISDNLSVDKLKVSSKHSQLIRSDYELIKRSLFGANIARRFDNVE